MKPQTYAEGYRIHSQHFEIERIGRIVCCRLYGSWDLLATKSFFSELQKESQPLLGGDWARVVDVKNWFSLNELVSVEFAKLFDWTIQNGMRHAAYIANLETHAEQMKEIVAKKMQSKFISSVTIEWFSCSEEAINWLEELGY